MLNGNFKSNLQTGIIHNEPLAAYFLDINVFDHGNVGFGARGSAFKSFKV